MHHLLVVVVANYMDNHYHVILLYYVCKRKRTGMVSVAFCVSKTHTHTQVVVTVIFNNHKPRVFIGVDVAPVEWPFCNAIFACFKSFALIFSSAGVMRLELRRF